MLADPAALRLAISVDVHGQRREWLMYLHAHALPGDLGEGTEDVVYSSTGDRFAIPRRHAAIGIRLLGPVDGATADPPQLQAVQVDVNASYLELGLARGAAFWLRAKALDQATPVDETHSPGISPLKTPIF